MRIASKLARAAVLVVACFAAFAANAETASEMPAPNDDGAVPQPLQENAFEALLSSSPFMRTLGVSDSLILTGIARFDNEVFATLLDTKTMSSQVVSQTPNGEGWQLVGVGGDPAKTQTWTARIQIPGGEIISIRYQEPPAKRARSSSGGGGSGSGRGSDGSSATLSRAQVDEAQNAAVNYREGFTSDGYPRQPPAEMVQKLSRLSVDQRAEINRQMIGHRNRGLGMEDRRRIYEDMVNRASQGRR